MVEILWHGRGGQGAFTAARLLGAAGCEGSDRYGLAFPSFGPERRGAPMRAFTKLDSKPIGDRSEIVLADYAVYLDDTLFGDGWDRELKPGGIALVNSQKSFDDQRILPLDASGISKRILKRDIPNTVFLAALCVLIEGMTAEDAKSAIRSYMPAKLHESNIAIVDAVVELLENGSAPQERETEPASQGSALGCILSGQSPEPPQRLIPTLRHDELDPAVFARTTCWEAGYLVSKNAGWRTSRPVVDLEACIGCLICYMDCPDGTIYKTEDGKVSIDYDFCKGCGICAKDCGKNAITMVAEGGEE